METGAEVYRGARIKVEYKLRASFVEGVRLRLWDNETKEKIEPLRVWDLEGSQGRERLDMKGISEGVYYFTLQALDKKGEPLWAESRPVVLQYGKSKEYRRYRRDRIARAQERSKAPAFEQMQPPLEYSPLSSRLKTLPRSGEVERGGVFDFYVVTPRGERLNGLIPRVDGPGEVRSLEGEGHYRFFAPRGLKVTSFIQVQMWDQSRRYRPASINLLVKGHYKEDFIEAESAPPQEGSSTPISTPTMGPPRGPVAPPPGDGPIMPEKLEF